MKTTPQTTFAERLGRENLADLRSAGIVRKYARGDLLFLQGDAHGSVFLIESGQVTVQVTAPEGAVLILGIYHQGDLLCEMSALEETSRSASGIARTAGTVTEIPGKAFRTFVRRNPDAMTHVLGIVRHRLYKADRERLSYLSDGVRTRVAHRLLSWATTYGERNLAGQVHILGFSRRELAQSVAAAEKSIDEVLGTLKSAGLIETGRQRFVLLDPAGLRDWSEPPAQP